MEAAQFLSHVCRQIQYFLVIALFLTGTGCVSYGRVDGPYEGKVVEAQTGKPIEGAVVVGVWYKAHPGAGGANHTYHDSLEVLTDSNGVFRFKGLGMLMLSNIEEVDITIFKAGYEQIPPTTWSGLSDYEVYWQGKKPTIRLKRMTMEESRNRVVELLTIANNKQKLLIVERNKEMVEIGRPSNTLLPVE